MKDKLLVNRCIYECYLVDLLSLLIERLREAKEIVASSQDKVDEFQMGRLNAYVETLTLMKHQASVSQISLEALDDLDI